MSVWALVVAAGSGTRMGADVNKVLLLLGGVPMLARSVRAFDGLVDGVVVVTRTEDLDAVRAMGLGCVVVSGADTRQRSVLCGLRALPEGVGTVLVHDGARPLVDRETILRCIASAREHGSGVAAVPVKDTIKEADAAGCVVGTPDRAALWSAQTPQAFTTEMLTEAIEALEARGETATDDAGAVEAAGRQVRLVRSTYRNIKVTTEEDLRMAEALLGAGGMRVGYGYDVHRLVEGRRLVLCGVEVPFEKGLAGHSDADVATHAVMDALLGAAAMGDIGRHFPDKDETYRDADSVLLLERVVAMLTARGCRVCNVDVTIICERPKIAPFAEAMRARLAGAIGVPVERVGVKATTTEGLGFEGEGLGISARAAACILDSAGPEWYHLDHKE